MTAPAITPQTFPYRRKWTQAEFDEILARKDKLVEAMTDAVGPVGQAMFVPPDHLHMLALHLALAGGDVHDDLAYIVSVRRPAGTTLFEDAREWKVKKEYQPTAEDLDETQAMAKMAADKIKRQLSPEVRKALQVIMADELQKVGGEPITDRDRAEAVLVEQEMRDQLKAGEE